MKKVIASIALSLLVSSGISFAMLSPATVPSDPNADASVQLLNKTRSNLANTIKDLENYARKAGANTHQMLRPIINRLRCTQEDLKSYNPAKTIDFEKNSACKVR